MNWSVKSAKSCTAASGSACSEQMRSDSSRRTRSVRPCETNWHATISVGRIPRFIPHTNPTRPDESDATGQVFFQVRINPTPTDHSDRMHPPHHPSVVGSIPTGPTRVLASVVFLFRCSQSSRSEQCNRRRCHDRDSEPSQNIGGETVHVFAHEVPATRHSHNDEEEWCGGHTIDHCH